METITKKNVKLFDTTYLSIEFDQTNKWLYCNWKGVQTVATIKEGCEQMLKALKANNCHKILNDNSLVKGTWTFAADWIANNWFPRIIASGLRSLAFIYSPDVFSKFSTDATLKRTETNGFTSATFKSYKEASQWLQSM